MPQWPPNVRYTFHFAVAISGFNHFQMAGVKELEMVSNQPESYIVAWGCQDLMF